MPRGGIFIKMADVLRGFVYEELIVYGVFD